MAEMVYERQGLEGELMILNPCSRVNLQPLLYVLKKISTSHNQLATANLGSIDKPCRFSSRSSGTVMNILSFY
jgi:hypothetical protein